MKRLMIKMAPALAALGLLIHVAPASAHVTVSPEEAASEGYAMLTFTVPHGCDGAATDRLRIQMPPQVISATPGVVPGWKISTVEGDLPRPAEQHGELVTEGVLQVIWSGGPLAEGQLEQFPLSVSLAGEVGEKVEFKAIQQCVDGSETAWIQAMPEGGAEPDHPAPELTLVAADEHGDSDEAEVASSGVSTDEYRNGLAIAALLVAGFGLVVALFALLTARRRVG